MKWSLFNWKKPVVSSGEPEDYQVVKNTVSQNERNITTINNQLANTVTTNTEQTITGNKTFNSEVIISRGATPLVLKGVDSNKHYLLFKNNSNATTFSLGSNTNDTSLEVNQGHLVVKTIQNNKNVTFENVAKVKLNRSVLECGTEINAGYGGGVVKFIPEDNSTKTLQFFNNNATDIRRFNLKINEPTEATNPATKNYVDTKKTEATTYTDTKITETRNYIDTQISGINMVNSINSQTINLQGQSANATRANFGPFIKETIKVATQQNVRVLSLAVQFSYGGVDLSQNLNEKIEFTYSISRSEIYLNFLYLPNSSVGDLNNPTYWGNSKVEIFYISSINTLIENPFYIVQKEVNNEN